MLKSKNIHSLDFAFRLVNGHGLRKNHAMLQDFESYIFYVHKTEEEKSINKKKHIENIRKQVHKSSLLVLFQ